MKKLVLIFMICTVSLPVFASDHSYVIDGRIVRVHMYEKPEPSGGVFVQIAAPRSDDPCPGSDSQFFIDLNEQPRGSLLYAHAMAAMKDELRVNINGSGKCEGHALVESIRDLQVYK